MALQDYYAPISIQRLTVTDNGMGGYIEEWTVHLETEGLINQADSKEMMLAQHMQIVCTHKLYTDAGQDITNKDRVVDSDGKIYRIVSMPKDTVNRGHHYKILLQYVEGDQNGL